ncbi:hypothetical protein DR999_PMT10795 [Platysternon megacephalum]|uniref:Uncharacterized protein n=1 Tax=Platysternon megacephalum TaxID=55544 RepID=A0A4D9EGG3_9SAUR|nr:hypothetical protein DR999_PMT10795 [Platysternon megacephalum]
MTTLKAVGTRHAKPRDPAPACNLHYQQTKDGRLKDIKKQQSRAGAAKLVLCVNTKVYRPNEVFTGLSRGIENVGWREHLRTGGCMEERKARWGFSYLQRGR